MRKCRMSEHEDPPVWLPDEQELSDDIEVWFEEWKPPHEMWRVLAMLMPPYELWRCRLDLCRN